LPIVNFTIDDIPTGLQHLEPMHFSHCLRCFANCVLNSILEFSSGKFKMPGNIATQPTRKGAQVAPLLACYTLLGTFQLTYAMRRACFVAMPAQMPLATDSIDFPSEMNLEVYARSRARSQPLAPPVNAISHKPD
jgi:hypothetical protein